MQFEEAQKYLLSLGHETLAMKLGLLNVERLLELLDHPQRSFTAVQIAGTNGKGSTAAMLESMCLAAGIETGLFTSPHLVSITERIRVGGRNIEPEHFARIIGQVRVAAERVREEHGALPTFFEHVTAAALVAFREAGVRLAILETGLGGRLDATTAARAAFVAITPVALDHQEYLGHTLSEIAHEKAAIIHKDVRAAIVAPQADEAAIVIKRRAAECGVAPVWVEELFQAGESCGTGRLRASLKTARGVYRDVCLALRGRHQLINASVAVALAETLDEHGFTTGPQAVRAGLEGAQHAGRLELDASHKPPLLFDGAHNAAGATALADYLDEFIGAPVTLLFGAMRDKPLNEIGAALFARARHLILTEPQSPRAASVDELVRAVPTPAASSTIMLVPSVRDALTLARHYTPSEGIICVTGSLYLVGEVKAILQNSF